MDLSECIYSRRSCREYKDKEVPLSAIGEILEAGTYAPSSGNVQNWTFIVVKDEIKREKIASLCLDQSWMTMAPVHIVLCNESGRVKNLYPGRGELYSVQNCAIVAGYMMLKAEDLGLGSCWVGGFDEVGVRNLLNIPDNITPEVILTIGYAKMTDEKAERTPTNFVTFFDEYGKKKADFDFFPLRKQIKKLEKARDKGFRKSIESLKSIKKKIKRN